MIVLDTHVLVWWMTGDTRKLSSKARQALDRHGRRKELLISSVTIFEITTLERRGRLQFNRSATEWLAQLHRLPEFRFEPVTDEIAERAGQFGDEFPGDPADRMIAATSLICSAPLVTHDGTLRNFDLLQTIW